jgi:hypothetical protein
MSFPSKSLTLCDSKTVYGLQNVEAWMHYLDVRPSTGTNTSFQLI